MRIKTHSTVRSTASVFITKSISSMPPSKALFDSPQRIDYGNESLATYFDTAVMQKEIVELARNLYFNRLTADAAGALWNTRLFPMLVDRACFVQNDTIPREDEAKTRITTQLHAAFEAEPLEDGMYHPAELIIGDALQSTESERVLEWLRELSLDTAHPGFSAEVLRCLARQVHPGSALWRAELVRDGLAMENAEIRDAAVRAAEWWGDAQMRTVLISHRESEPWLQEYIRDVIDDLGE